MATMIVDDNGRALLRLAVEALPSGTLRRELAAAVEDAIVDPLLTSGTFHIPKAVREALVLSASKGGDYNKHTGRDAYFPLGLPSYAQMVHVKSMRLVNLAATREKPNFESVRDTCLDLINYAWFLADAIERGEI